MSDGTNDERWSGTHEGSREDRIPLDLGQRVELTVQNPNGDVAIRAVERPDALVRHVKHGQPGTPRYDEAELLIEVRDNRIEVRPDLPNVPGWAGIRVDLDVGAVFARGRRGRAESRRFHVGSAGDDVRFDIEVELPRSAAATLRDVRTATGNVTAEGIAGTIGIATASGDVTLRGGSGELSVQTASGDLRLDAAQGRLTARTASGDARVTSAALDEFVVQSVSGDVALDAALTAGGPYRIQSVSGDVRLGLALPAASAGEATLFFETLSGDARVGPPFRSSGRRTWRVGTAEGGPRIAVKTVSGDLTVKLRATGAAEPRATDAELVPTASDPRTDPAAEPVTTAPPVAAQAMPNQAARLAVLEAVERGEIEIDEAMRRLDETETARS